MSRSIQKFFIVMLCLWSVTEVLAGSDLRVDLDTQPAGLTWRAETTQPNANPADWGMTPEPAPLSSKQVLSIRRINDTSSNVFNLRWTPDVRFESGSLEVLVRANSGTVDQGGGLIWRVRDARNYYLARYNPLENNLRVYIVTDGVRRQLASAENITIPAGRWWQLRIAHTGNLITAWIDGVKHLQLADDALRGAGGIGLWAKADAASSFDNLLIRRSPSNSDPQRKATP